MLLLDIVEQATTEKSFTQMFCDCFRWKTKSEGKEMRSKMVDVSPCWWGFSQMSLGKPTLAGEENSGFTYKNRLSGKLVLECIVVKRRKMLSKKVVINNIQRKCFQCHDNNDGCKRTKNVEIFTIMTLTQMFVLLNNLWHVLLKLLISSCWIREKGERGNFSLGVFARD